MKKIVLMIGSIITLSLAVLWYIGKISEPLVTVGTGVVTLISYVILPSENNNKPEKKIIKQKHYGKGDNVGGNKILKK